LLQLALKTMTNYLLTICQITWLFEVAYRWAFGQDLNESTFSSWFSRSYPSIV